MPSSTFFQLYFIVAGKLNYNALHVFKNMFGIVSWRSASDDFDLSNLEPRIPEIV